MVEGREAGLIEIVPELRGKMQRSPQPLAKSEVCSTT